MDVEHARPSLMISASVGPLATTRPQAFGRPSANRRRLGALSAAG